MYECGTKLGSKSARFAWVPAPPVAADVKYVWASDAPGPRMNGTMNPTSMLLRSDGVVETRMGTDAGERMGSLLPIPGGKRTVYSNVVSPWVSLSVGRAEFAWLRADGHVDILVGHWGPTNFGNLWTTVAPPPGERYVAVSSGASHDEIGPSPGTSVSYLLRDNGSIDRRSTTRPSAMHTSTRSAAQVKTLLPDGDYGVDRIATTLVKPKPDSKLGISLETYAGSGKIEVASVAAGSPTEAAGLRAGDIVVEIAGRPAPPTAKECTALLKEAVAECAVTVERKRRGKYVGMSAGYYSTFLVRDDGAVDVLLETTVQTAKSKEIIAEKVHGGELVCTIPAPAGTAYVGVAAQPAIGGERPGEKGWSNKLSSEAEPCILIRADGRADYTTADGRAVGATIEPSGAPGVRYVSAACGHRGTGESLGLLVRSDGAVDIMQGRAVLLKTLAPPAGQRYVSATAGGYLVRSDGRVDTLHHSISLQGWAGGGPGKGTADPRFGAITQTIAPQDAPAPAGGCCMVQ